MAKAKAVDVSLDEKDAVKSLSSSSLDVDMLEMIANVVRSSKATIAQRLQAAKYYREFKIIEASSKPTESDIGTDVLAFIQENAPDFTHG